jgi:hypothetical protein
MEEKLLVLGHSIRNPYIKSISWEEPCEVFNIGDYDRVIIDLTTLNTVKGYHSVYLESLYKFIFDASNTLIIVGNPERCGFINNSMYVSVLPIYQEPILEQQGTVINSIDENYQYYFRNVGNWNYYFLKDERALNISALEDMKKSFDGKISNIVVSYYHEIAQNTYYKPISFISRYEAVDKNRRLLYRSCLVKWFPPVTQNKDQSIRDLIENELGYSLQNIKPIWMNKYELPNASELSDSIKVKKEKSKKLQTEIKALEAKIEKENEFQKLLYENGTELEQIVMKALMELGCELLDTTEGNNEDLQMLDPEGDKWIIEVKGRKGNLKRDDIRQLDEWVRNVMLDNEWQGFGLIIGNYQMEKSPDDREGIISDREQDALDRFNYSVLTTTEIFQMIVQKQKDEYDPYLVWKKLKTKRCKEKE